jgi:hypothetical protein
MLRVRAVHRLLVEDVSGIHLASDGERDPTPQELAETLEGAARKALVVSLLLGAGLVLLLMTRQAGEPFFGFEGVETVFSIAALLVAGYAGFRLAQWRKYRTVARALLALPPEDG